MQIQEIALEQIQLPYAYRFETDSIDDLRESIRQKGLLQPILIRYKADKSNFIFDLIAGYRRYCAVQQLAWQSIPSIIINRDTPLEQLDIFITENMERKNLSPMELSELILQRKRFWELIHGQIKKGIRAERQKIDDNILANAETFYEQTARYVKKPVSEIYRLLQLQGLDEDLKKSVAEFGLSYRKALKEQIQRNRELIKINNLPKKSKLYQPNLPQPPEDLFKIEYNLQNIIWRLADLYHAIHQSEPPAENYDLTPLDENRLGELMHYSDKLIHWLNQFHLQLQNTLFNIIPLTISPPLINENNKKNE